MTQERAYSDQQSPQPRSKSNINIPTRSGQSDQSIPRTYNSPRNNNILSQNPVPKNYQIQHPQGRAGYYKSIARDNQQVPKDQFDIHRRDDIKDLHWNKQSKQNNGSMGNILFNDKYSPANAHKFRDEGNYGKQSNITSGKNQKVQKSNFERSLDVNINNRQNPANAHKFRDNDPGSFRQGSWNKY